MKSLVVSEPVMLWKATIPFTTGFSAHHLLVYMLQFGNKNVHPSPIHLYLGSKQSLCHSLLLYVTHAIEDNHLLHVALMLDTLLLLSYHFSRDPQPDAHSSHNLQPTGKFLHCNFYQSFSQILRNVFLILNVV